MSKSKLSLFGGKKVINKPLKKYNSIGKEELLATQKVVRSGVLSKFIGSSGDGFYGGEMVQKFERDCEKYFKVKHALTVNSWTSGLIAAVGAIGIEPGDEVIVTPWTMCATATAILHWNGIPVFADIEPDTFNLCPNSIRRNISNKTKAIMVADIFGQSCDISEIMKIARENKLKVICDSAQSPGVLYKKKIAGTLADVGGFSLNYHKHIHTGEGGILVTNNSKIYERLALIRNHAEAAVIGRKVKDLSNMVGYNFRLGEIEAAIGIEQLKKLKELVKNRQEAAKYLTNKLQKLNFLKTPVITKHNTHAFYIYPIILDIKNLRLKRSVIIKALRAEGLNGISEGYVNLHMLPLFQKKIAFGKKGFPWNSEFCSRDISYSKGICPIAEGLHDKTLITFEMCLFHLSKKDLDLIIKCFFKVWDNLESLRNKNVRNFYEKK